ncbi:MAG: endonuclease/exonuclease/phosphatase family protein [Pirellulales bacterium]
MSTVFRFGATLLLILLCSICNSIIANHPQQSQTSTAQERNDSVTLKIISYNVQFLPQIASFVNKRAMPDYRATTIGDALSNYDIIGLNELFADRPKDLLIGELKRHWGDSLHVYLSPQVDPKRYTGGLAILSRFPIVEKNAHTYTQFSKPEEKGFKADGFVTKGVLHARIAIPKQSSEATLVDLFVTHMESQDPSVRPSQYSECAEFIREHSSANRPAILMGDFNTRGNQAEMQNPDSPYHQMIGKFKAARAECRFVDVWTALGQGPGGTSDQLAENGGNRIDYIFAYCPTDPATLEPTTVKVHRFLDDKVVALSDHSAVEATLALRQTSSASSATKSKNSSPSPLTNSESSSNKKRLILIGDSTVKNGQGKGDGGLWGWGQVIAEHFDNSKIEIENRALGGRSSRSYLTEGLWDKSLERVRRGDYVMIQFGHNDGGQMFDGDRPRASIKGNGEETKEGVVASSGKPETVHSFGWYLRKYVSDIKAKGATPIICSLVPRNRWQDEKVIRSNKDYGLWASEAASQSGAPFIDLNELVALKYEQIGQAKVAEQYFTAKDWTHTNKVGAELNAKVITEAIRELKDCDLRSYLRTSSP